LLCVNKIRCCKIHIIKINRDDRKTLSGVRVWLIFEKMAGYQLIRNWFERSNANRQKPAFEEISKEILAAASDLIVHRPVRLQCALKNSQPMPTGLCPKCGEAYPLHHGQACPSYQGEAYYTI
jgi:formylmethanofuran dehydrogenase subunit E